MDPLRLGFRSIVGITMPGTIVVLSVLYGLWAIDKLPPIGGPDSITAALWGIAFFLISYVLGSIVSLRACGRTDRLSGSLVPEREPLSVGGGGRAPSDIGWSQGSLAELSHSRGCVDMVFPGRGRGF